MLNELSSAPDAASATAEGLSPPKKRKKKHGLTRELSSGSIADLSSNVGGAPLDPTPSGTVPKNTGPFVVDSPGRLQAVSRVPASATTHTAEKPKKKAKNPDDASVIHTTPRTAPAAPTRTLDFSKIAKALKRTTHAADDSDVPLAKKAKKKAKESAPEEIAPQATPGVSESTTVPGAQSIQAPHKQSKKISSKTTSSAAPSSTRAVPVAESSSALEQKKKSNKAKLAVAAEQRTSNASPTTSVKVNNGKEPGVVEKKAADARASPKKKKATEHRTEIAHIEAAPGNILIAFSFAHH